MAHHRPHPTHPISGEVVTTVERTIVPLPIPADAERILPYEVGKYATNGYGRWEYGPGVPIVRRTDLLGPDRAPAPALRLCGARPRSSSGRSRRSLSKNPAR